MRLSLCRDKRHRLASISIEKPKIVEDRLIALLLLPPITGPVSSTSEVADKKMESSRAVVQDP
jgi:hypothetical protein